MKNPEHNGNKGFILIELMVVIAIIGALTSIAIPNYLKYRDNALAAACLANRRNIEVSELAHYTDHNAPNLIIVDQYTCPTGGEYVWLVSDPDDPEYPKVACSIHYAGNDDTGSTDDKNTTDSVIGDTGNDDTDPADDTDPGDEIPEKDGFWDWLKSLMDKVGSWFG